MCKINGKKLADIRTKNGISQASLAKALGVPASTVSRYENGKADPSEETVDKICLLLRISKDDVEIKNVGYDFKYGRSNTSKRAADRLKGERYKAPKETEAYIRSFRTADQTEEKELAEVESKLEQPMVFAGKTYIQIDPTYIHIPTWQRNTDFAKVEEIAENYDANKFDPIKAYLQDGKLNVADGAHREVAAIVRNHRLNKNLMILTEVLNCDEAEARRVFLYQKAGRKDMTVCDMYRAAIENKENDYMKLKEICESWDVQITAEDRIITNPIGKLTPSKTALRLANANDNMMQIIICLMKDLNWTGSQKNAFTMRNFSTLKKLFANYGDSTKAKLLANCKGAAFYESMVAPVKSNAELYDILVREMNK